MAWCGTAPNACLCWLLHAAAIWHRRCGRPSSLRSCRAQRRAASTTVVASSTRSRIGLSRHPTSSPARATATAAATRPAPAVRTAQRLTETRAWTRSGQLRWPARRTMPATTRKPTASSSAKAGHFTATARPATGMAAITTHRDYRHRHRNKWMKMRLNSWPESKTPPLPLCGHRLCRRRLPSFPVSRKGCSSSADAS